MTTTVPAQTSVLDRLTPTRRHVLLGAMAAAGAACSPAARFDVDGVLSSSASAPDAWPPSSSTPADPVVHLAQRATYAATPTVVDEMRRIGPDVWLSAQLATPGTSAIDVALDDAFPERTMSVRELRDQLRAAKDADDRTAQPRLRPALVLGTLVRQVASPAQLHERMVEFWSDHFNVPATDQRTALLKLVEDRDVIRPHALGRFADLLVASAQSPAMLDYLDGARSFAGAINENYARELLELHTVGVDGGYDEDDVVAVARLLTGWAIGPDATFRFVARRHDRHRQPILGWEPPGRAGDEAGMEDGIDFLQHLARSPATARHVCTKLAVRFVGDDPDPVLVDDLVSAWTAHDTAIVPVLEVLFAHDSFATAPPKFRRPWDFLVATLRVAGVELGASVQGDRRARRRLQVVEALGQAPFAWPAPNGYPDVEAAWLHAGGMLSRWNLASAVLAPNTPFAATTDVDFLDLAGPEALYR